MNDWHDAEQRVEKAQELFAQKKWREALAELRAAVAINPYNPSWHFNIGLTLDELELFDEAVEAYEQSLEIEPNDIEAAYHLAEDLSRLGRQAEALEAFERCEQIDSSFEPSYCGRIVVYAQNGDHEKAEEMFYLARQHKEECPHCFYNIGASLFERKLFEKAIYCWQKTIDLENDYPEVHLRIAEAHWETGQLELARQHYLEELRRNPGDTDTLLDLGMLLGEMNRHAEAGEKFRRAIEQSPEVAAAHFCHGRWLAGAGRQEEAQGCFERSLKLDPTHPGAHLQLARILLAGGNNEAARTHLRAEMVLRPDDPETLLDLSNRLMDCTEHRAALACLKRLIQLEPQNADAWHNLAVAHFLRDRFDEGIAASKKALEIDPDKVMAMHNLALAHERKCEYTEALHWVREAAKRDGEDAALQRLELRIRLLRLCALAGRAARSLLFWKKRG